MRDPPYGARRRLRRPGDRCAGQFYEPDTFADALDAYQASLQRPDLPPHPTRTQFEEAAATAAAMVALQLAANPEQLATALERDAAAGAAWGGVQPTAPTGSAQPGATDADTGYEQQRREQARQQCLSQCDSTPYCPSGVDFNACWSQHNTEISMCKSRCQ